jgi:glycosyltransferase involved in cell wall biosynthesis
MKILHINEFYRDFGGAERYLFDVCAALENSGHQIVIIASSQGEHISVPGRREYFLDPSYGVRTGFRMWNTYLEILQKERPDIIHLHNTYQFVSPLIIKKMITFGPIIKFVHDARFFCPRYLSKIITGSNESCLHPVGWKCIDCRDGRHGIYESAGNFLLTYSELKIAMKFDKIIAGSRYMHEELLRNHLPAERVALIPCFTDKACNPGEADITFSKKNGIVLCIGRFDGLKGISEFIDAMNCLKTLDWRAEIVGDGLFRNEMEEKVRRLGLEKKIRFLGRLSSDEIDRCYRQCSVAVIPSMIPESFGLVGIEAMAFGKPVVAFDSGGIKEWLVDNETGFAVRRGDIKEMASRIDRLLGDGSLSAKMGMEGRLRVEELYRVGSHVRKLVAIYGEAIKNRADGHRLRKRP